MQIAERILLALSRPVGSGDYPGHTIESMKGDPLELLHLAYPDLSDIIRGKRVIDFGCGAGLQAVTMVREYGCVVCGVDLNPKHLQKAADIARQHGLGQDNLTFRPGVSDDLKEAYDVVISQNSMEHFPDPVATLAEMASLVKPGGKLLITFGPPWFAPHGSHMMFFCKVPWINLLFPERVVMNVRRHYRKDGASRYEEVESGLNKMSIRKFERLVAECGLRMERRHYTCVRRLNFLARLPLLRELFINHATCVLVK